MAFFISRGGNGWLAGDVRDFGGAMDIVQRLILALLLLVSCTAQAEDVLMKFSYAGVGPFESRKDVCLAYVHPSWGPYTWNNGNCINNMHSSQFLAIGMVTQCKGSFFNNYRFDVPNNEYATCRYTVPCPDGQIRKDDGSCSVPPVVCQQGRVLLSGPFSDDDGDGRLQPLACIEGCYAHLTGGGPPEMSCGMGESIGVCYYVLPGDYIDQGESCSPDDKPVKDPPADRPPCPACDCMQSGGSWGQINGVDACMPRGAPGTMPVQTKPAPTIKEDKPKPTPENPDPETTRTVTPSPVVTVTPNPKGGEPTVKEETTNPDGSTTTKEMGMGKYCEEKPNSQTCKSTGSGAGGTGGGGFQGSCESGFICTGDGVQCAIAKKIHQDRCDDLKGMEPFADVAEEGRKILTGETDQAVTDFLNRDGDNNRNINVGNLVSESGDYQFGASCISDLQFSIGGHSITVPFSSVCPYFEMIGFFLLAAAYLAALRIVEVF